MKDGGRRGEVVLRPTFTAPLCATRPENRMERLGSRQKPNAGHAVELYTPFHPTLKRFEEVQGLLQGGMRGENREYYS